MTRWADGELVRMFVMQLQWKSLKWATPFKYAAGTIVLALERGS